jgi:acyl-coenzyme A synthetase/AMP-(fatty) acid ligase
MEYEKIRLEVADGLATLTFARPEVSNARDVPALNETLDAFFVLERRDDVGFYFVSRADEVIISRAYRISSGEVEAAVVEHPEVLEAAAIGVPDEEIGQRVKVVAALKPGFEPSEQLAEEIKKTARR